MRSFLKATFIWVLIALAGASAVIWLGLYNVSARQGHFPGVAWVLHTAYRNAVLLRAPPESEVPDLASASLIALGRGHYEDSCAFCHALPGEPQNETVLSMLPAPPHVTDAVADWEPRHLYWIVKNGVKMTGMPGWPSDKRDDDVWAVVAFLNAIMTGRSAAAGVADPAAAVEGSPPAGIAAIYRSDCADCHGANAEGNDHVPRLDTLPAPYVAATLKAYRADDRHSGIMQQAASQLSDTRIEELSAHIAALGGERIRAGRRHDLDPSLVSVGERLAHGGDRKANIPACVACHGPGASPRSDRFPPLAGQSRIFLLAQLRLWKLQRRGGTDRAVLMHEAVRDLTEDDMQALAEYYASLPPAE
tara:strand:- start:4862 stop:5947 length:1086 start_codon:yes stop_codon:yes gene_type:complete